MPTSSLLLHKEEISVIEDISESLIQKLVWLLLSLYTLTGTTN